MHDFNEQLITIKDAASNHNQDTIVSVVTIGVGYQACNIAPVPPGWMTLAANAIR